TEKGHQFLCYAKETLSQNSESFSSETLTASPGCGTLPTVGIFPPSSSHPDCICPALSSPSSSSQLHLHCSGLSVLHQEATARLLISPSFLTDDWCMYQMHQALSEGPMSQRIIPAVLRHEPMKAGYTRVYRAVLQCENFK
uniref:TIR domain-containing protein n=1 Tax=Astyanax mexicanus TaxID=7994 RepID=A0A3B1IUA7_ASTMX